MGLDTSHNCWHGPYSTFYHWRKEIARAAGLPPLELMEGFFESESPHGNPWFLHREGKKSLEERLPIKWESLKPSPLHALLNHSDCDGELRWQDCGEIAKVLSEALPRVSKEWQDETIQFIAGLLSAHQVRENVDFH